uniref:Uncharacterized protein n=1 Tax=Panagrolaimus sp. PS1159 TaxID=55785 RepID=A0AC35EZ03_9BILA
MRFSIFATLFLIVFAIVTVEARYRLKYPKGEFGLDTMNEIDTRVRRSNSIKVKRSVIEAFNPEEHDEQVLSFLEDDSFNRGEGIA